MTVHQHVRTLTSAALLALAIGSALVGLTHAGTHNTQQSCEAAGFNWYGDVRGCADQTCYFGGHNYRHNEAVQIGLNPPTYFICNGFTGEWQPQRTAEPQTPLSPRAPRPITTGR